MAKKFEPRTYNVAAPDLHAATLNAVQQLGYKLTAEDSAARSVSFNTGISIWSWGGQDMTAQVTPVGDAQSQLDLGGTLSVKIQATSWGEKKKIAKKLYAQVDALVGAPAAG